MLQGMVEKSPSWLPPTLARELVCCARPTRTPSSHFEIEINLIVAFLHTMDLHTDECFCNA